MTVVVSDDMQSPPFSQFLLDHIGDERNWSISQKLTACVGEIINRPHGMHNYTMIVVFMHQ